MKKLTYILSFALVVYLIYEYFKRKKDESGKNVSTGTNNVEYIINDNSVLKKLNDEKFNQIDSELRSLWEAKENTDLVKTTLLLKNNSLGGNL